MSTTPIVESGIPSPRVSYPWGEMSNGQSFVVPLNGGERKDLVANIHTSFRRFAKRSGSKAIICTRSTDNGVRVWLLNDPDNPNQGEVA